VGILKFSMLYTFIRALCALFDCRPEVDRIKTRTTLSHLHRFGDGDLIHRDV